MYTELHKTSAAQVAAQAHVHQRCALFLFSGGEAGAAAGERPARLRCSAQTGCVPAERACPAHARGARARVRGRVNRGRLRRLRRPGVGMSEERLRFPASGDHGPWLVHSPSFLPEHSWEGPPVRYSRVPRTLFGYHPPCCISETAIRAFALTKNFPPPPFFCSSECWRRPTEGGDYRTESLAAVLGGGCSREGDRW